MKAALIPISNHARTPLRVLFVVDGCFPATGGAEMQARMLAAALVRAGHLVSVLAPRVGGDHPVREILDGVAVRRLGYPRIKGAGAVFLNLRYGVWLLRHQREFDAIHIHMMHNLAGATGWLKPWLRPRVVVKVSGAAEFHGGILDPELKGRLKHRLLNFGARRLDIFQCISRHTVQMLQNLGYPQARLHLIPNAVDASRFDAARVGREGPVRVVFAGRHVQVKALDILLRAWAQVRAPNGSQLVLAGDGPEHTDLIALARELGIGSRVQFPGVVRDIPALLRDASLYVQASHQEGLPNSVLEAMASALPVVATRVSGHEDVVCDGTTGLLVPPGDPRALAHAMQTLVDSPNLRSRMGMAGREVVLAGYSLDRVLEQLLHLYRGEQA